ncbi:MAG: hypothetical protein U5K38_09540 [Woeseiaceae bacterium]|nr:hypothetical protein [Woeseiaceae bacterium]
MLLIGALLRTPPCGDALPQHVLRHFRPAATTPAAFRARRGTFAIIALECGDAAVKKCFRIIGRGGNRRFDQLGGAPRHASTFSQRHCLAEVGQGLAIVTALTVQRLLEGVNGTTCSRCRCMRQRPSIFRLRRRPGRRRQVASSAAAEWFMFGVPGGR